ncbi:proline--tRNA ligase [Hyphomonas sp. WL0036]|uniref:proline--tRNA ligase n=1 Tax=Hyphomonas sediminis TaxID=2866160 RepID=UPI001C820B0B|nr:proline--tRNA ligase [Hyphomonas sediminis]MBY9067569.1 proline--tRNA ligase [Hyphomonas sediminis]
MRLSKFFLPVSKEAPSDAAIVSHQLMLRTGMVRQNGAGIYTWLPLGYRVLKRIEQIVREEMNRAGAVELLMPTLQQADLWRESGRYDDYGKEMLRIKDRHDRDMLYGPTNEELITDVFRTYVKSYKQLPLNLYHQQWKFRDEVRPRFGVMRGREFLMKDAYSFDLTEDGARAAYRKMFCAYLNAFNRMGLTAVPMRADTGPIGGDLSHEFIILAETGESAVFCDKALLDLPPPGLDLDFDADLTSEVEKRTQFYAATEEMHDEAVFDALPDDRKVSARGIEVGHIFYFGTKYSKPMNAVVQGPDGQMVPVQMGSYGIGVSRLVGALIEACHDESGIVWPEAVAPFDVGLINMRVGDEACDAACKELYAAMSAAGQEVLYDDTDDRAGAKFARMDLIGLPRQITVGPRGLADGKVEVKDRKTGDKQEVSIAHMLAQLKAS